MIMKIKNFFIYILSALTLAAVPFAHSADKTAAPTSTQSFAIPAECRNLGKVNDIDDLFFQMYSNLDSNCLFEIPAEELESIWGLPVLDFSSGEDQKIDAAWARYHEINAKEKTLYLEKRQDHAATRPYPLSFHVKASQKLHERPAEKSEGPYSPFGGSMGEGKFPRNLPKPTQKRMYKPNSFLAVAKGANIVNEPLPPSHPASKIDYRGYNFYYWINKGQDPGKPLLLISITERALSPDIEFYQKGRRFFPVLFDYTEDL